MSRISKPALVLVFTILCACSAYLWPSMHRFQPWTGNDLQKTFLQPFRGNLMARIFRPLPQPVDIALPGGAPPQESAVEKSAAGPPSHPSGAVPPRNWPQPRPKVNLLDAGGSLRHFYEALQRTKQRLPGATTRICHFGDSPITGDLISGDARRLLQHYFGDAGPGWILAGRPWEWYQHRGMTIDASGWRTFSPWHHHLSDWGYGLGGCRFSSGSADAVCAIALSGRDGKAGVSRVEIHYEATPQGGTLLVSLDDASPTAISTRADPGGPAVAFVPVAAKCRSVTLSPQGDGPVDVFGVVLEKEGPGVVYDALGCMGASALHLAHYSAAEWERELRLRAPDLVILNFGTNESGDGTDKDVWLGYAKYYRQVVHRIRDALPGVSILLLAPMDRGMRDEDGEIVTMPAIPGIVAMQRQTAADEGCAFFDTFRAMGGEGTMARWYELDPPMVSGDFTHPSGGGAGIVARCYVDALMNGFERYEGRPAQPPQTQPAARLHRGN